MIQLTESEVYACLYRAFEATKGVPPQENSIEELDEYDKADLIAMTLELNVTLASKQA